MVSSRRTDQPSLEERVADRGGEKIFNGEVKVEELAAEQVLTLAPKIKIVLIEVSIVGWED